jgi:hypothetical protein
MQINNGKESREIKRIFVQEKKNEDQLQLLLIQMST